MNQAGYKHPCPMSIVRGKAGAALTLGVALERFGPPCAEIFDHDGRCV